jgi:hypothetical protein
MGYVPEPPFRVDRKDQFQGHCEDGFGVHGYYDRLEDAIAEARKITEEAIRDSGSFEKWYGMSDAGLVYDAVGRLLWSGVEESVKRHQREHPHPTGGKERDAAQPSLWDTARQFGPESTPPPAEASPAPAAPNPDDEPVDMAEPACHVCILAQDVPSPCPVDEPGSGTPADCREGDTRA